MIVICLSLKSNDLITSHKGCHSLYLSWKKKNKKNCQNKLKRKYKEKIIVDF